MSSENIKQLIANGKIDDAIQQTELLVRESSNQLQNFNKELLSLRYRLSTLNSSYRKGILKEEDKMIELNKINDALISMLSEIEQFNNQKNQPKKNRDSQISIASITKVLTITYSLNSKKIKLSLLLLISVIIFFLIYRNIDSNLKRVSTIKFNTTDLQGLWKATSAFMKFETNGQLEYVWHEGKYVGMKEKGIWRLNNDTLITDLGRIKSIYIVEFQDKNSFKFRGIDNDELVFDAKKSQNDVEELNNLMKEAKSNCSLNNKKYKNRKSYNEDFIQFFNKTDNIYEYSGKISIYSIGGKVNLYQDKVYFVEGNVSGNLTLLSNCNSLVGSININDSYSIKEAIDFVNVK